MQKKKHLVVGNWKMNPLSPDEAKRIIRSTKKEAKGLKRTEVVICPPYPFLSLIKPEKKGKVFAGVQDVFWQTSGTFTGEVSPEMIRQSDGKFAIIGHSERRKLGETDAIVAKKTNAALSAGLTAIVCVGESSRDNTGDYLEYLKKQLAGSLVGVKKRFLTELIIAYEPLWAISSGYALSQAMKPSDVHETTLYLKKILAEIFGKDWVSSIRILYGGSVSAENAGFIIGGGGVDGLLVGRESLDLKNFPLLLKSVDAVPL